MSLPCAAPAFLCIGPKVFRLTKHNKIINLRSFGVIGSFIIKRGAFYGEELIA